jgi:hypothetical protein
MLLFSLFTVFLFALSMVIYFIFIHPEQVNHRKKVKIGTSTTAHDLPHHHFHPNYVTPHAPTLPSTPGGSKPAQVTPDPPVKATDDVKAGVIVENVTTGEHVFFPTFFITINNSKVLIPEQGYFDDTSTSLHVTRPSTFPPRVVEVNHRTTNFSGQGLIVRKSSESDTHIRFMNNTTFTIGPFFEPVSENAIILHVHVKDDNIRGLPPSNYSTIDSSAHTSNPTVLFDTSDYVLASDESNANLITGYILGPGWKMTPSYSYVCEKGNYYSLYKDGQYCQESPNVLKESIDRTTIAGSYTYEGDEWSGTVCPAGKSLLYRKDGDTSYLACV